MGIFEFPAMIEPDGGMGNLIVALAGVAITMVIAFAATMIFYKDDNKTAEETATGDRRAEGGSVEAEGASETVPETDGEGKKAETRAALLHQTQLYSPLRGRVLKLESLKDDAFASGVLGKGVGIWPEEGNVYAPADGVVSVLFPTLHAIGFSTDEGVELLIHIGLDTVQLNGEGFQARVAQGDRVKKGQLLVSFDMAFIEEKGYCLETPVLVTNSDDYLEVVETAAEHVAQGDVLLKVLK